MKTTPHIFFFLMMVAQLSVFVPSSCAPTGMVVVACLKKATDQERFDSLRYAYSELLKRHEARTDKGAELVSRPSREHFLGMEGFDHQKTPRVLAQEYLQRYLATRVGKKSGE